MKKVIDLKLKSLFAHRKTLLCYIGLFLIVTLSLVAQAGKIINPDGVEYIAVAHHYAIHDFNAAINGIVSPLLSWLLAIPISLSLDPFYFFRFIAIGLSILVIIGFDNILRNELKADSKRPYVYNAGLIFITAFCIYATLMTPLTPDLFSVFFIICLLIALRRYRSKPGPLNASLIGISAGLGYYGKNYFAYFAIAAYGLYFLISFLRNKKQLKQMVQHFAIALVLTLAFVGPWIGLMSLKYGQFTTNPIGSYVIGVVGPHYPGAFYRVDGLLKPPYPDSFDSREDPTFYKYSKWSPLGSIQDFKFYIKKVVPDNIRSGVNILYPQLILLGVTFYFVLYESKRKKFWATNYKPMALIIAGAIYVGGYCLIDLAGGFRYIWPAYILFGLAFLLMVDGLKLKVQPYLLIIGTLLLALYPIITYYPKSLSWAKAGEQQQALAKHIKERVTIPKHSRVASNNPLEAPYACYHLELQCYGSPVGKDTEAQFKEAGINYVFNYNYTKPALSVKNGTPIYHDNIVTIFKLSN